MKMTSGMTATGNIVASTPQEFFDKLAHIFNFTLDVCALPENAKCEKYYTPEEDGLKNPWRGGYGVTLPMEERYPHGSRKVTRNPGKTTTTYSARIDGLRYEIVTYELCKNCFTDFEKFMEEKDNG